MAHVPICSALKQCHVVPSRLIQIHITLPHLDRTNFTPPYSLGLAQWPRQCMRLAWSRYDGPPTVPLPLPLMVRAFQWLHQYAAGLAHDLCIDDAMHVAHAPAPAVRASAVVAVRPAVGPAGQRVMQPHCLAPR